MKKFLSSVFFLIIYSGQAMADQNSVSEPIATERLKETISLMCQGMVVDEWKADSHFVATTSRSLEGIEALNQVCNIALKRYADFLHFKNYQFIIDKLDVHISMLPANILLDGKLPRNLNDSHGRMKIVDPVCCDWGVWDQPTHRLFLRNDPIHRNKTINKYWKRTFLHEMAHILNEYWHVREKNFPGNRLKDEEIAEEWVKFLGINYLAESSEEDLLNKDEK